MSSATPSSTAGHSQGSWWWHCSQAATSAALLLALRTSRKQGLAQLLLLLLLGVGASGCLLLLRWACLCGCLQCHPSLLCPGYQAQVRLLESCSSWALPNAVEPGQGLCSVLWLRYHPSLLHPGYQPQVRLLDFSRNCSAAGPSQAMPGAVCMCHVCCPTQACRARLSGPGQLHDCKVRAQLDAVVVCMCVSVVLSEPVVPR
jgi:hypothetical protein